MSPLERRYRALLRVLPPKHRAARGEELLGLLLDLDEGRARPSFRQAVGVVGLGLRLRLGPMASLVVAGLLISLGTHAVVEQFPLIHPAAAIHTTRPVWQVVLMVAVPAALALSAAVAWACGARRTTLGLWLAQPLFGLAVAGPGGISLPMLVIPVALGTAVWWLPAPRQRRTLLATIPLAALLWAAVAAWGRHGIYYPQLDARSSWMLAGAGAGLGLLTGLLAARRARRLTRIAAGLAAAAAGTFLPGLAVKLAYGQYHGWTIPITILAAVTAAIAGTRTNRIADETTAPSAPNSSPRSI